MPSKARSAATKAAVAGASSSSSVAAAANKTRQSSRVTKPTKKPVAKAATKPNANKSGKTTTIKKRKAASPDQESELESESEKSEPVAKKKKKTVAAAKKRKSASLEEESESEKSEHLPKKTKTAAPSKKRKAVPESKSEPDRLAKKAKTTASSKKNDATSESKTNTTSESKTKAEKTKTEKTKKNDATSESKTKTAAASKKSKAASEAKSETEKPKPAATSKKTAASKSKAEPVKAKTAVASKTNKADVAEDVKPKVVEDVKLNVAKDVKPNAASQPKKTKPEPGPTKPKIGLPIGKKINSAPTQVLDVYVFGEGSAGELGLGSTRIDGKKPIDVKRPRINEKYLSAKHVGVVQIACGGMHSVALTRNNVILTWGVNDNGALGRDTTWDGGLRDVDASEDSDSDSEDSGLNPLESTPTAVSADHFAPGTKFAQVVACDSATFALTEDGQVYGWGTFRSDDGIFGFTDKIKTQMTPIHISGLKNIKSLAAGANHVLALDTKGTVLAWGSGQQNQLGRRIIERNKMSSLLPQSVGLARGKIVKIACGGYHSFALDNDGHVWGWGLNNFGEIWSEDNVGEDNAIILKPVKLTTLYDWKIAKIDGGVHHSVACSDAGDLLTWGRIDGYQIGFEMDSIAKEDIIFDERELPRILAKPCKHKDLPAIASVAAGTDNSFAISRDGKAYSWGFSANYQTGLGIMDDVHTPTLIDNSAIRDKKIIAAYAGGQFSVLVCVADEATADDSSKATADGPSKAVALEVMATATADDISKAVAPEVMATADDTPKAVALEVKATAGDTSKAVALDVKATADGASKAEAPEGPAEAVAPEAKATADAPSGAEASDASEGNAKALEADEAVSGAVASKTEAEADEASVEEATVPETNGLNGH